MANLNIFCVIEGQTKSFSVKVPSDGTVDDLKKAIKEENPNTLEKVDAKDLTLWHVEIPDEDKALTKNKACREEAGVLTVDKVVLTEGMDIVGSADGSTYSTQLLSPSSRAIERFFPQQPKAEHIHIIVQYAQSGLSESEVLRMVLPDVELVHRADRHPSTASTRSTYGRTPIRVQLWAEFEPEARLYSAGDTRSFPKEDFRMTEGNRYNDESTLTTTFDKAVLATLERVQDGVAWGSHRAVTIVGEPDRVLYRQVDQEPLLLIEIKTPSVLRCGDLVEKYNADLQEESQELAPRRSCVHIVEQIFGYLFVNNRRYGVLTTYEQTWFFKRINQEIFVSPTISHTNNDPTVLRCYSHILTLARTEPEPAPPVPQAPSTPSAGSVSAASSMSIDERQETELPPPPSSHFGKWNAIQQGVIRNLASGFTLSVGNIHIPEFEWQGIIGEGRTGSVFRAGWRGETVAAKICDLYQHPELEDEVLTEVAVYHTLSSLQGHFIPQMRCAGYYGRFFVVATEVAGTPMQPAEFDHMQKLQAVQALSRLHEAGILHGDIRIENFLIRGTKVFLIDFGMSEKTTSKQAKEQELQKLKKILAL